jgi:hypothetical protein
MVSRISGPIDFKKGFSDIVLGDQRVWDRSQTVGASEVFRCHRRTYFAKHEPESATVPDDPDDLEWGYSERGNEIERKYAVPKLKAMFGEENCFLMGDDQQTFVDGNLSATPDGIIVDLPSNALAKYGIERCSSEVAPEIKSFDPRTNVAKLPKPFWVGQSVVQQGVYPKKTNYKPTNGIILAINCSNLKEIHPFATTFDPALYERAHQRADAVFTKGATAENFEPEGQITGECSMCPFFDRCNAVEMARYPDKVVAANALAAEKLAEVKAKAKEVAAMRAQAKELEAVKKVSEAQLKELMFEIGTNRLGEKDDWSVSITKCAGRMGLDKAAAADDGVDLSKYMRQGNGFFQVRVKG